MPQQRQALMPSINIQVGDQMATSVWSNLIEEHFEWLLARNYSPRTVVTRRIHLRTLAEWCVEANIAQPSQVTKVNLECYQNYLYHYRKKDGQPLSFRTQRTALVPVQVFFKWLVKRNYLQANPASELELPKTERRLPMTLTASEVEKILTLAGGNGADPLALRDRAILETLYSTGLRRMELSNLKLYDVETMGGRVFVRQGKGRKDRVIPIGERAASWVERYVEKARPQLVTGVDEGWLFLTHEGRFFSPERMTEFARDYVNRADVGKKGACHLFRHTCATLMLEGGADVRFIQQMLGHAQLTTTQLYTQVSIVQLQRVHALTHPARMRSEGKHGRSTKPGRVTQKIWDENNAGAQKL